MIQDLDGATSEPSRRRHVAALSAVVAAASLILLMTLVVPAPRTNTPPLAASPTPSPTDGTVVTFASWSQLIWFPNGDSQVRGDATSPLDVTSTMCAAGIGSTTSVHLVLDRNGRVIAAYSGGTNGRFIPLPQAYVGSGWLTVPCDTSDIFAPRINRAR